MLGWGLIELWIENRPEEDDPFIYIEELQYARSINGDPDQVHRYGLQDLWTVDCLCDQRSSLPISRIFFLYCTLRQILPSALMGS
jgi:hypothetical protein